MALQAVYVQYEEGDVYHIHIDNKAVFKAWQKGRHAMINQNWVDIWDEIFEINISRAAIRMKKVKAHCDEAMVEAGEIALPAFCGNHWADHYAGEAAKHAELAWSVTSLVDWIDATTWLVQTRLLAIAKTLQRQPRDPIGVEGRGSRVPSKVMKLEEAGHSIVQRGGLYHCCACLWERTMRKQDAMLRLGSCPGVPQYKMDWEIPLVTMATSPHPRSVQEGYTLAVSYTQVTI